MRQGEVYEYVVGSRRIRIVAVSAARYNPQRGTYAVIQEPGDGHTRLPASVVVATEAGDPVRGVIDVTRLRPLDQSAIRARVGRLTFSTLLDVKRAIRTYLDL